MESQLVLVVTSSLPPSFDTLLSGLTVVSEVLLVVFTRFGGVGVYVSDNSVVRDHNHNRSEAKP
jgi:hypothetical protein